MKVLVIGDRINDKYIYGTSTRISPEAPVPVVTYKEEKTTAGGAMLVWGNLKNLGVDVDFFDTQQPASVKTRIICDGHYITRIDDDKIADGDAVYEQIKSQDFSKYNIVVLSDYNKGTLRRSKDIIDHINKFDCKIIVDPKKEAHNYYGAWLVKPNASEFYKHHFNNWQGNIITTNAGGNVTATIDDKCYDIPVQSVEVSDVTGAGDCFLAAFVYALTREYDHKKCLEMAINASTESVKHQGTYVLDKQDVEYTKVFTNGCFDIVHRGHIEMLRASKELGDWLVVGLNTDRSVKRLKGDKRPINSEGNRKVVLESLDFVDEVILFDEDTPIELIKRVKPDIITKGGDYTIDTVVGNQLAEVVIIPTVENFSTTETIKRMQYDTA